MSLNLNHVQLAGHLTRDPQVKTLANQRCVAAFSIAINRRFKQGDGEMKDEVTFVDCEAWGRTAELVGQYLTKGSACYIDGRLKLETWQDKDQHKHSRMKVVAEMVQFIGRAPGGEPKTLDQPVATSAHPTKSPALTVSSTAEDDLPPF